MKKTFFIISFFMLSLIVTAWGQHKFTEDFDYTAGDTLTKKGYLISSGGTTNAIRAVSPGLTFTGYASSGIGNAVGLITTGQDVYKSFPKDSGGSFYSAFMVSVSAAQSAGDYFFALSPAESQTNYYGRIFIKSSGTGFVFGLSKSNETAKYGTTVFSFSTTYLVVVKYTFSPADTADDILKLYALSTSTNLGAEPLTAEIIDTALTRSDAKNFSFVTLRQGAASNAPTLVMDGIRIGTTWNDVFFSTLVSKTSVNFGKVNVGTGVADSVYVKNTGTVSVQIDSAVSSDTVFVVTPKTATIAVGDSQKFVITFTPSATTASSAIISFKPTGATAPDTVVVSGEGIQAGFLKSVSNINFGNVIITLNKKDSLYIKNTGSNSLNISAVASDNAEFAITPTSAALSAEDSAWFYITFAPTSAGAKTGNIVFTHDAPSSPDTVKVSGTGTAIPPPAISNITRPSGSRVPNPGDSVVVMAKVKDQFGIDSVRLKYFVNDAADSVNMTAMNDSMYTGKIPGSVHQNGTRVEYQVLAYSHTGQTTLSAKSANSSYFAGISKMSLSGLKKMDANLLNLYKGYYAKVTGVINGPNYQATNLAQYVQDDSGGLNLFKSGALADTLNRGDSIIVLGRLDQFRGTTEIVPDSSAHGKDIQVVGTGKVVAPINLTAAQFNANPELYESRLVRFTGLTKKYSDSTWPGQPGNIAIVMYQTGSTDTLILFNNAGVPAVNAPEPAYPVTITAIAVQFASSGAATIGPYEILPRYVTDFEKTTGVKENSTGMPKEFSLSQNFPNPFNPSTTIKFGLPNVSNVTLKIYDVIGREVASLVSGQLPAGYHTYLWNAAAMSSGVYFYKVTATSVNGKNETFTQVKKLLLMK